MVRTITDPQEDNSADTEVSVEQLLPALLHELPGGPGGARSEILLDGNVAQDVAGSTWFAVRATASPHEPLAWQRGDLDVDGVAVVTRESGPTTREGVAREFRLWAFDASHSRQTAPEVMFALWSAGSLPRDTRLTFGTQAGRDRAHALLGDFAFTLASYPGPDGTTAVDYYGWSFTTTIAHATRNGGSYEAQKVLEHGRVTRAHEARDTATRWLEHAQQLTDLKQLAHALQTSPEPPPVQLTSAAPPARLLVGENGGVLQVTAQAWAERHDASPHQFVITPCAPRPRTPDEPAYVTGIEAAREAIEILLAERRRG